MGWGRWAWTAGGIIMSHHSTSVNLMPFTPLLLGSHQPMSACSFKYKACKMDSQRLEKDTWGKKTDQSEKFIFPGVGYLWTYSRLTTPENGYHWRRVYQVYVTIAPCKIAYSSSFHKQKYLLQSTCSTWAENDKNSRKVPSSRKGLSTEVVSAFGPNILHSLKRENNVNGPVLCMQLINVMQWLRQLCSLDWAWIAVKVHLSASAFDV